MSIEVVIDRFSDGEETCNRLRVLFNGYLVRTEYELRYWWNVCKRADDALERCFAERTTGGVQCDKPRNYQSL